MTDIADRVRQIIVDHFAKVRNVDPSRVVPNARLVEDLGADSLDLVELVFLLEDQFDREISEGETAKLITVGEVIALIERECRGRNCQVGALGPGAFPAPTM